MTNRLLHRVEVRWPHKPYFTAIAAFDCERAAIGYAKECAAENSALYYRTMSPGKAPAYFPKESNQRD